MSDMTSLYLCMSEVLGIHKMHSYTHTRLFKFKIKGTTNLSSLVNETKHVLTSSIKSRGGGGGGWVGVGMGLLWCVVWLLGV